MRGQLNLKHLLYLLTRFVHAKLRQNHRMEKSTFSPRPKPKNTQTQHKQLQPHICCKVSYCMRVLSERSAVTYLCCCAPCASMKAAGGICACMHGVGWQGSATDFARTTVPTASMRTVCSVLTAAVNIRARARHLQGAWRVAHSEGLVHAPVGAGHAAGLKAHECVELLHNR